MRRVALLAILCIAMADCAFRASISEQLIRNNYLSTGRAPEGWMPKKSLCPDFDRNGWQDHPNNELCWMPVPQVTTKGSYDDPERVAFYARAERLAYLEAVCKVRYPGALEERIAWCIASLVRQSPASEKPCKVIEYDEGTGKVTCVRWAKPE